MKFKNPVKRICGLTAIIGFLLTSQGCVSPSFHPSRSGRSPDADNVMNSKAQASNSIEEQRGPLKFFDWPVNEARLTRGFFLKPKKKRGRPHLGIDLAAPKGTAIYAAHSGLVIYVGREFSGYGKMVMIEGQDGFASLYAHLSKTLIKAGSRVQKGQLVGEMGRTGRATGVHLHFEIRKKDGPVDPLTYLPGGAELVRQARASRIPAWVIPDLYAVNDSPSSKSWMLPQPQLGVRIPSSLPLPLQSSEDL